MRALLGPEMEEYLDEEAEDVQAAVERASSSGAASGSRVVRDGRGEVEGGGTEEQMGVTVGRKGDWVAIGGVTGYNGPSRKGKEREVFATLEDEVKACFHNLRGQSSTPRCPLYLPPFPHQLTTSPLVPCSSFPETLLSTHSLPLTSIASISLLLSSMDLFPAVNAIYKTFFGSSPPTRACVAVPLPKGERVRLEAVAFAGDEKDRNALHVQSLSYWAPANIGPYSQVVIVRTLASTTVLYLGGPQLTRYLVFDVLAQVGERISLAGQIPLIPHTLALPSPASFSTEVALSLKHVRSIVRALKDGPGSGWESEFVEGCIGWVADFESGLAGARAGWKAGFEGLVSGSCSSASL